MTDMQRVTISVLVSDLCDAIGSLELRAERCREWAAEYAAEGYSAQSAERTERAEQYESAAKRLREAISDTNRQEKN